MTAGEERNRVANVEGTRHAVELANALEAGCFHHASSIAVAGTYKGLFREDMFDEGQKLDHPYHRTKFESEKIARDADHGAVARLPARDRRRRLADRRDGQDRRPVLLLHRDQAGPALPARAGSRWSGRSSATRTSSRSTSSPRRWTTSRTSPASTARRSTCATRKPQRSGDVMNAFAEAAHAPKLSMRIDTQAAQGAAEGHVLDADAAARGAGRAHARSSPTSGSPKRSSAYVGLTAEFDTRDTERALEGSGISGAAARELRRKLWDYWERNLDPDLFKDRSFEGAVNGKTVLITGASSGIGKAAAMKIARAGGIPLLVARSADKLEETKQEIEDLGGTAYAYSADISDPDSVDELFEQVLADHAAVDMLVNNAGRSIRRSVALSYDRFHDFERTIQLNYLGTIKLIMGLLPHMRERKSGLDRQRLLDRRADQPAALLRLRGLEGGARRVDARRRLRDDRRRRPLHDDPHAARAHADDRPDEDLRQLPDDLPRRGRRPDLRGDPREAQADQHAAWVRSARSRTRCSRRPSTRSSRRPTRCSRTPPPPRARRILEEHASTEQVALAHLMRGVHW